MQTQPLKNANSKSWSGILIIRLLTLLYKSITASVTALPITVYMLIPVPISVFCLQISLAMPNFKNTYFMLLVYAIIKLLHSPILILNESINTSQQINSCGSAIVLDGNSDMGGDYFCVKKYRRYYTDSFTRKVSAISIGLPTLQTYRR